MATSGQPTPHDLLWGLRTEHLPADAPAWVVTAVAAARPVVVRRAPERAGWVAVGIRGQAREERFASWLPSASISKRVSPEQLVVQPANAIWPALHGLNSLRGFLDQLALPWGVTGSVGFQLATGIEVLHAASDLDLLLRVNHPFSRDAARELIAELSCAECRVDLQLQTPHGGLALSEWASAARQVMLKTASGPRLVTDPWAVLADE